MSNATALVIAVAYFTANGHMRQAYALFAVMVVGTLCSVWFLDKASKGK